MPKQTKIAGSQSLAEIEKSYRQAAEVVEKSRWQVIWLLAKNTPVKEVAAMTGYREGWVREVARRYNQVGALGLSDRRKQLPGLSPLLNQELQTELNQILQQPHPQGGQWSGPKVAAWIADKIGKKVSRQQGWCYLKRLNYSLQMPRPQHCQADLVAQAEFKKNYLSE